MAAIAADRNLLFGLLALQNGLIDQVQLVAAFQAWTRDKSKNLADHLEARGDLTGAKRTLMELLAEVHLQAHGGDVEMSLAALNACGSTRESLAQLGDADVEDSLAHVGVDSTQAGDDRDRTASYSVGTATSEGQRFRVLRPHARGGLGAVFVALDTELHREVALKQILDSQADDPASRQRFLLEAEVTGGLEHPGIVPVYGFGTYEGGRPYYAMRFIRGDSLKVAIERFHADEASRKDPGRHSLELRKLLRRFLDVCNAIEYAHSRGVLHRDIKPGNVIVGRHGETLVVDWGLAKATGRSEPSSGERTLVPSSASGSAETLPGSALGTPAYMSPEQAEGQLDRLGPRSDVYSLGATLYCLLAGRAPFTAEDAGALLRAVQEGNYPPPRLVDPSVDLALEAVCLKAMARNPEDRYPTTKALADDVERWYADLPVTAWREPLSLRARRWARRNRSLMMAASAAVIMALAGSVTVLAVQTRANGFLRQANVELAAANAKVNRANVDLHASNEREQQRFDLALEAIRRYHTDLIAELVFQQDQFKDLRDRLLRDAVGFYHKLETLLLGQVDARSRQALGRAYEEVGELTGKIGSIAEALATHGKALEVRRTLAREATSDSASKADVGRSLIAIGTLLEKTGRTDEALAAFEEARSALLGLAGSGAGGDAIRGDIARSYYGSGWTYSVTAKIRQAMAAYEAGREIGEELVAAHPDVVEYRRILAWSYNDIGLLWDQEGHHSQALVAFEQALRIKQKLAGDHPSVAELVRDVAGTHGNLGIALREAGKPVAALAAHEKAVAIWQRLARAYPSVTQFQRDVANGLNETADVLRVLDRTAQAQDSYTRALKILEALIHGDPMVSDYQVRLLQTLRGIGATQLKEYRPADALATLQRAVSVGERLRSTYYEPLYYLAGCHALLGGIAAAKGSGLSTDLGTVELDRAMNALHRAAAAGFRSVAWLRRDPDLDPLRSRLDFQLLMMDLAMPDDPFAAAR
jgi:serine/threonine-protein kinase